MVETKQKNKIKLTVPVKHVHNENQLQLFASPLPAALQSVPRVLSSTHTFLLAIFIARGEKLPFDFFGHGADDPKNIN